MCSSHIEIFISVFIDTISHQCQQICKKHRRLLPCQFKNVNVG